MTTLATGAFGGIGAWVCKRLLDGGERGEQGIDRVIHLAAWQVPLGRQDPARGALINVVGTAKALEAVKAHEFAALQRYGRLDARELGPVA